MRWIVQKNVQRIIFLVGVMPSFYRGHLCHSWKKSNISHPEGPHLYPLFIFKVSGYDFSLKSKASLRFVKIQSCRFNCMLIKIRMGVFIIFPPIMYYLSSNDEKI